MKSSIAALTVGFIFAIGLGLAGMTNPENVVSFLDIFGRWSASLVFVMGGALIVHTILFRLIVRRPSPLFAAKFQVPNRKDIDKRLVLGAVLFGLGWGLAGYCPAPAITSVASLSSSPIIFVLSMLSGMILFLTLEKKWKRSAT